MFFLFLSFSLCSHAQTTGKLLHGVVTDQKGRGIRNAVCKLQNAKDSTLAFALTTTDGKYTLNFRNDGRNLVFSKIGYRSDSVHIQEGQWKYDISLEEEDFTLQEVVVVPDPISRSEDTIRYNVNVFRQKEDLYIEDVIKRLPGIEVGSNGEILYQGKSINKLNIEGMDLMGSNYNQATRNMPAEAVAQIQVIENDQPIRSLEGKIHSDKATLNIKLNKKHKLKPFGEAYGSIGLHPSRWDNRINAFKINSRNQLFLSLGMNNQGNDFSYLTNAIATDNVYLQEPLPNPLLLGSESKTPPISPLYHLQNKTSFVNMNYLHAFTDESTFRINTLYYHNTVVNEDSTFLYFSGKEDVVYWQNNHLKAPEDVLKGQAQYELNSKKVFLQEALTGTFTVDKSYNRNNTNLGLVDETVTQRPRLIQNSLNMNINLSDRLVQVSSIARLYRNRESIHSQHGGIQQTTDTKQFFTRNRAGTSFDVWRHPLLIAYIFEHKRNVLDFSANSMVSHSSHYTLHTLEPTYEIGMARGHLDIHLPVEYIDYRYDWTGRKSRRLLFSPVVNFSHQIGGFYKVGVNMGSNQDANTSAIPTGTALFSNYRTIYSSLDSMSLSRMSIISSSLSYLNTGRMLSWNVYAAWSEMKSESYLASVFFPDFTYLFPVWGDNTQTTWTVSYQIMKVFRASAFTLRHKSNLVSKKMLLSQNDIEDYVRTQTISSNLSAKWSKLSWFHANFVIAGNLTWKSADKFSASKNLLKNFYYTLRTDFYPIRAIKSYIDFSQATTEISHGVFTTLFFVNAGLAYDLSKRATLELSALNISDRRAYEEALYTGGSYTYYQVPLRGREITIGARIRL